MRTCAVTAIVAAMTVACASDHRQRAPLVQPGLPGEASHTVSAAASTDLSQVQFTGDDVKFMQGMIAHHGQAVAMVALIPSHTGNESLRMFGKRIELSQVDEMRMMRRWLELRGQNIRGAHMMGPGGSMMPGMLTEDEMHALAEANGSRFDQLFLEGMIKHHGGALSMVRDLFATPGAGQEVEIFSFASDVDGDQRMEIERMGAMLNGLPKERHQ